MSKPKPKIAVEVTKRYYVMIGDWTYGGPFISREEAKECLDAVIANPLWNITDRSDRLEAR